jgi:fluoroacetyl-CoA thioesterase
MDSNGVEVHAAPAVGVAQVGRGRPLEAPQAWVGAVARVELTVTDADTAQAVGSGDVPVLATPRVVALVEAASVAATTTRLPPGTTTVGTRVDLEHRAATAVGHTVVAEARLAKVDGRRLEFEVVVREGGAVVAEGRLERVLVDRHTFVARAFGTG